MYGLKEAHNISSFDTFFQQTGLYPDPLRDGYASVLGPPAGRLGNGMEGADSPYSQHLPAGGLPDAAGQDPWG